MSGCRPWNLVEAFVFGRKASVSSQQADSRRCKLRHTIEITRPNPEEKISRGKKEVGAKNPKYPKGTQRKSRGAVRLEASGRRKGLSLAALLCLGQARGVLR